MCNLTHKWGIEVLIMIKIQNGNKLSDNVKYWIGWEENDEVVYCLWAYKLEQSLFQEGSWAISINF